MARSKAPASKSSASRTCRCSWIDADVDDYVTAARETGGMFARLLNAASEEQRETITARLAEAFVPFAVDGGIELPGVVCAIALRSQ